jgi:hypothetical protein
MKRYTHFTENEITGEYYDDNTLFEKVMAGLVLISLLVWGILMIADSIFGAETVTNYLAEILA